MLNCLNQKLSEHSILVVEDDEVSFLIISEFLKRDNYNIIRAVNGKEAVSMIKGNNYIFDLVLMDIFMPVMNGFKAAKKIKKFNQNIPIIAQTAVTYDWVHNDKFSIFDHVLLKPLDFSKLRKLVSSMLQKSDIANLMQFQEN